MIPSNSVIRNYCAGAVTALAYAADLGVDKETVFRIAEEMGLSFDDIDQTDKDRLVAAYGDISQ